MVKRARATSRRVLTTLLKEIISETMRPIPAYIIAARRTAIGRIGGLHKSRRLEELCAPVIAAALSDSGLEPAQIEDVIIGNASEGGNPARLIALAAGLPETASASTIDRQCGSGLDAILAAIRIVAASEVDIVVAGGAEAISMAPWRIAKPSSIYQTPHFTRLQSELDEQGDGPPLVEAAEALWSRLGINRAQQDAYALRSHLKAEAARRAKRFINEIVPMRANPEETRDQSAIEPDLKDLSQLAPYLPPDGTLTPGNTSAMHDGAAFAIVVSQRVWESLAKPRALRLVASTAQGVRPDNEPSAPIEAMKKLKERLNGYAPADIGVFEMSESSAAQAIALAQSLDIDEDLVNPDGGAIARGHPFGAASAVLVTRLFTRMVRGKDNNGPELGVATLGVFGGMGLAALFESV
ncbi:MAG: thiolase family protein [Hyphomicrobium sp.]